MLGNAFRYARAVRLNRKRVRGPEGVAYFVGTRNDHVFVYPGEIVYLSPNTMMQTFPVYGSHFRVTEVHGRLWLTVDGDDWGILLDITPPSAVAHHLVMLNMGQHVLKANLAAERLTTSGTWV
jgi:hypothetical protein